ncbi:MAG: TlpA family protein disulfide reductase [Fusobacteriota bacterium]
MKKILVGLIFSTLILFQTAYSKTGIQVGNELPNFDYYNLMGVKINSQELEGKAIMLNFWATWCPPCREEMPSMQKLYEKYKNNDKFEIVAISVDKDSSRKVSDFINKAGYTFPIYYDEKKKLSRDFLIRSIPTTYLINSNGIIVEKKIGAKDWENLDVDSLIIDNKKEN